MCIIDLNMTSDRLVIRLCDEDGVTSEDKSLIIFFNECFIKRANYTSVVRRVYCIIPVRDARFGVNVLSGNFTRLI